jgi:two-component system LytT family sensor kinase
LLSYCCTTGIAQQSKTWLYQYYNTSYGLSSPDISALAKDNRGFLWVGSSSGLAVYDGYTFHQYAYSKANELIGRVNVIKAGEGNVLWIGASGGLFRCSNNDIIKISAPSSSAQGVNDILLDKDIIWLATENGPAKIHLKQVDTTGIKKIILPGQLLTLWVQQTSGDKSSLLIAKATDNSIYISQYNNLFRLTGNQLQLIHTTKGRDKILSLFPVNQSLIYFDAVSSEINKVQNDIITNYNPENLYKPGIITSKGNWYVGTRGAYCFHPENGSVSAAIHFTDKYLVWPTAILKDNDFFWLASQDGLVKLKPVSFSTYPVVTKNDFTDYYAVTQLTTGQLLLGSNRGNVLEKKDSSFIIAKHDLVNDAEIRSFYEDERGWLWIASGYRGLVLLQDGHIRRFTTEHGLHDNSLLHFFRSSNGRLYVMGDRGMSEIIVTADKQVSFKKISYQPNSTAYAKCFSAAESVNGSIWIASEEGLLRYKNDSLKKFILNGKQLHVNFLIKDQAEKLWIATAGDGILQCIFNKQDEPEIIKQYTETDGLNTAYYLTLLADRENNIWAGSSRGLSRIGRQSTDKASIMNFDESDGFIKNGYSYITLYQDNSNRIWAATTFGFVSFDPRQLLADTIAPKVYITGISEVQHNELIPQKNFLQLPAKNEFPYYSNAFNFTFTALDYASQENIRYYYRLDGLDTNWANAGNLRSINFENLAPGKYTFGVKALNSKGTWSKQDAVYIFHISLPFWKTWWFILLLLTATVTLLYFYIRKRENIAEEKQKQQTEIQALKASNYQYRFEINQVINYFANSIHEQTNVDDLLWDVAKNCIAKLGFEDCVIYLKNNRRNILLQKAAWGPKTNNENKIVNPIELLPGKGIVGAVALTGKAEIVNDTTQDKRYVVDDAQRLSEITIPIINNGEVIGIIDSEHPQKNFYTERHLQILTTIASLCADKMDKIKAAQQTREKEIAIFKLNQDLATSQLTALRAQMNPHFIFNALNSIQQYILTGNVDQANKYLSKFSRLQRDVLNHSDQDFITLDKEIEMLQLYLELEQLRFNDNFEYRIDIPGDADCSEIKIPPMILQPFVENAIWHGLIPKQDQRQLLISFTLPSYQYLQCIIKDNGIGRAAAAIVKLQSGNVSHQSRGLGLVYERLLILQQQYRQSFTVTINDNITPDGVVQGTEVILTLFIAH